MTELKSNEDQDPVGVELSLRTGELYYGVLPEIRPAKLHMERGLRNLTLEKPLRRETKMLQTEIEAVSAYQQLGYIIPLPTKTRIRYSKAKGEYNTEIQTTGAQAFNTVKGVSNGDGSVLTAPYVVFRINWMASLPDGYSALILPLRENRDRSVEAVPSLIDLDNEVGVLEFLAQVQEQYLEEGSGKGLGRLIPIDRQRCALDARIEPKTSMEENDD